MSSFLFEIVELSDGGVGLRRAGEDGEPLIRIKFSPEADDFLQDSRIDVVKAMIEAGMEVFGELADQDEDGYETSIDMEDRVLH